MTLNEQIRQIWAKSGYTYKELSEITKIPENTLASWITTNENRKRVPPLYVVDYIKGCVRQSVIVNNADAIRRLSDKQMQDFLEEVSNKGIEDVKGFLKDNTLKEKYKL